MNKLKRLHIDNGTYFTGMFQMKSLHNLQHVSLYTDLSYKWDDIERFIAPLKQLSRLDLSHLEDYTDFSSVADMLLKLQTNSKYFTLTIGFDNILLNDNLLDVMEIIRMLDSKFESFSFSIPISTCEYIAVEDFLLVLEDYDSNINYERIRIIDENYHVTRVRLKMYKLFNASSSAIFI